ncbi:hypothetical protein DVH24_037468 [Malus domestica]|uniref:Uncharacterized protein n=1 Tax=Malus domestica TaxID=3750 RepID=A0A498HH86_MALDO|nr:hypothetical protein DVH24_037468 [Malus domestica]
MKFQACVLSPPTKAEKKVRSILEGFTFWKIDDEVGGGVPGLAGDADAHPYVSFTINLIEGEEISHLRRKIRFSGQTDGKWVSDQQIKLILSSRDFYLCARSFRQSRHLREHPPHNKDRAKFLVPARYISFGFEFRLRHVICITIGGGGRTFLEMARRMGALTLDGAGDGDQAENWLEEMERLLQTMNNCLEKYWVSTTTFFLI